MSTSIWDRLEFHAPTDQAPEDEKGDQFTPKKFWRRVHLLDCVAAPLWFYAVTKLLLVDWDREVVSMVAPGYEWLVNFRLLALVLVLLTLAYFGKKMFPLWLAYIMLWPLLIVTWRVPWRLLKHGRWNSIVGSVHVLVAGVSGVRSFLAGLALWLLAIFFLVLPGHWAALAALAFAASFQLWLMISSVRAAITPSKFIAQQRKIIQRVQNGGLTPSNDTALVKDVVETDRQLTPAETQQFLTTVSNALMVNRVAYFWAYRLNEYRQSAALIGFSVLSIIWLFFGTVAAFTLANLALYQSDGHHYDTTSTSVVAFIYYAITGLYGGETEVISPVSDAALAIKVAASVIGSLLLVALFVSFVMSFRYTRDEQDARRTVAELREGARRLEGEFSQQFTFTPAEAVLHLQQINHNLTGVFVYLTSAVPDDFDREP